MDTADNRTVFQPHDHFFRVVLAPETAGNFLRERLPPEMVALLAADPPELVHGSLIDGELKEHLTDRLYRVRLLDGGEAFIYALLEHKSWQDRWVGFQLYRYVNRILEQWVKENPDWEKLPPVIPVVVYHGATAWKIPNEFHALLAGSDILRPYLPGFRFIVVDLGQIDDGMISGDPRLRVGLLALKYVFREKEQTGILETIGISLRDVPEMLYQVVLYIVQTYKSVNEMEIRNLIHTAQPREEAEMMSQFARDILANGKPEWANMVRQEGRHEGKASSLLKLMHHRFGQIPGWVSTKINSADTELIETWMIRVLDAQSVEDVFAA